MQSPTSKLILRGADPTGNGWYGAKRGKRKHKGLDVITIPGEQIAAPITGKIMKFGYAYANALRFRYIDIKNSIYKMRIMYVGPDPTLKIGDRIYTGQIIGVAQDIAAHHGGGMQNHIHIELKKNGLLTDPEPLLKI